MKECILCEKLEGEGRNEGGGLCELCYVRGVGGGGVVRGRGGGAKATFLYPDPSQLKRNNVSVQW